MALTKNRKEVTLDGQTMAILQIQAEKEGRKLKNYMEHILKEKANEFELTDEYKAIMDTFLDKHTNENANYTPWENFKNEITK